MLKYPTRLCDPEIGISYGCKLLSKKIYAAKGDINKGLLYYNEGGNPHYPDEVLARKHKYEELWQTKRLSRRCPPGKGSWRS